MIPEVVDELPECVRPFGKRHDDVDERAARVHALALHLRHRAERPEEHELCEVLRAVAFKRQLVNCSSVPLCTSQPCHTDTQHFNMFCPTKAKDLNSPENRTEKKIL